MVLVRGREGGGQFELSAFLSPYSAYTDVTYSVFKNSKFVLFMLTEFTQRKYMKLT
jgi:hypothetical protein